MTIIEHLGGGLASQFGRSHDHHHHHHPHHHHHHHHHHQIEIENLRMIEHMWTETFKRELTAWERKRLYDMAWRLLNNLLPGYLLCFASDTSTAQYWNSSSIHASVA